jgi:hypothetical protein
MPPLEIRKGMDEAAIIMVAISVLKIVETVPESTK